MLSGLPAEIHAARRIGEKAVYYFLLNLSSEPKTVDLPEPMIDLWNNSGTPVATVRLEGAGGAVLKAKRI